MVKAYTIPNRKHITPKIGYLSSIEDYNLPITIKRIFYIKGFGKDVSKNERGNHGHRNTTQCMIVLNGKCSISINDQYFEFENDENILVVPPNNFISIKNCSEDCIILVMCDKNFKDDIVFQ